MQFNLGESSGSLEELIERLQCHFLLNQLPSEELPDVRNYLQDTFKILFKIHSPSLLPSPERETIQAGLNPPELRAPFYLAEE